MFVIFVVIERVCMDVENIFCVIVWLFVGLSGFIKLKEFCFVVLVKDVYSWMGIVEINEIL